MENELLALLDHRLGDVVTGLLLALWMDARDVGPFELQKFPPETNVDTRRLDLQVGIVQGFDDEIAGFEPGADIAIGKDHASIPGPEGLKNTRSPTDGTSKTPAPLHPGMKQAIVVRSDLDMSTGKLAAQVAHAALSAVDHADSETVREWKRAGQRKVVLGINGERALFEIQEKAKTAGLPTGLIRDAGRTQLDPDTPTTVAVGPASDDAVDRITGSLSLY